MWWALASTRPTRLSRYRNSPRAAPRSNSTPPPILPGGQVASAMVACQTWGLRTRYIGKFGDDYAAQLHRATFANAGVETHLFTAPGCPSHQSFILIDADGERTVLRRHDDASRSNPPNSSANDYLRALAPPRLP